MPINYLKANKKKFIDATVDGHEPMAKKTAIFMAGTPGSGKTETASSMSELLATKPVVIDADKYRELFPGYDGTNSKDFQSAASLAVDKVFDYVVGKGYSFILDGTFSVGKAAVNIKRSLRRGYKVRIIFVFQKPEIAWEFTKKREIIEGRIVPKEAFVDSYFKSRQNIISVKQEFAEQVAVSVIVKEYDNATRKVYDDVDDIEEIVPIEYNKEELARMLND